MSKPMKRGAIFGIILLVSVVINVTIALLLKNSDAFLFKFIIDLFLSIITYVSSIFYIIGFIVLAKRTNIKLLKVVNYISLIFIIIGIIVSIPLGIYNIYIAATNPDLLINTKLGPSLNETANALNLNQTNKISPEIASTILGSMIALIFGLLFLAFLLIIGLITLMVLGGVGLIKLGKEFPLAKITGILEIVTIGLALTIIGIIFAIPLAFAVSIMKIVLLFQASKKYEKTKIKIK